MENGLPHRAFLGTGDAGGAGLLSFVLGDLLFLLVTFGLFTLGSLAGIFTPFVFIIFGHKHSLSCIKGALVKVFTTSTTIFPASRNKLIAHLHQMLHALLKCLESTIGPLLN